MRWWTLVAHHRGMSQPPEFVNIELWKADAIVLFNWLMSVELNEVPITHRAEKQALMDLLTQLEVQTGVLGNFSRRDRRRSRRGLEEYGLVAAPSFPRKRLPRHALPAGSVTLRRSRGLRPALAAAP